MDDVKVGKYIKSYRYKAEGAAEVLEGDNLAFLSEEDYEEFLEHLRAARIKQIWKNLQVLPREGQVEQICAEMELLEALMARLNAKKHH